jgi:hypothetical protein
MPRESFISPRKRIPRGAAEGGGRMVDRSPHPGNDTARTESRGRGSSVSNVKVVSGVGGTERLSTRRRLRQPDDFGRR